MFNIVLFEPEIPPNTGNIIRLAANTGSHLHLIEPLGFELDDKKLRRAGLDYREFSSVTVHKNWLAFIATHDRQRIYAVSTKGKTFYTEANFNPGDYLLFGPESRGLPADILGQFSTDQILRIPMQAKSRSLNLSNAAAAIVYEAWRQNAFEDAV